MCESSFSVPGKVYLVGAGPGDPGLITLRAVECLGRADCVLYDYLANPRILRHACRDAELICLGRHGGERLWTQAEIHHELVQRAGRGQIIVRLKGGDPLVFGRLAEEAECLASHGVPFEIVPGITAALAAGAYAGIPVTHRDLASAVALVTGQEQPGKLDSSLDFSALARFPGTLVFYMGVTTAPEWTEALIRAGKPWDTPVAIVRRCSLPNQQTIRCRLGEVAARLNAPDKIRPPAVVIVGQVTEASEAFRWFEARPLFGQTIVVTRPVDQAAVLADRLAEFGADVLVQPAIEIGDPPDFGPLDHSLQRLSEFAWVVFSSANGVNFFFDRLLQGPRDLRALAAVRLACIGPGTAETLGKYHLRADLIPDSYRAEALAATLAEYVAGRRILLVRASRGREILAEQLRSAGAQVEQVVAYESRDVTRPDPAILERLIRGEIDWITVTSSAIARSLVHLFGDNLNKSKLVSISPITTGTLRELGLEPAAEATVYTMEGVVEAIARG